MKILKRDEKKLYVIIIIISNSGSSFNVLRRRVSENE